MRSTFFLTAIFLVAAIATSTTASAASAATFARKAPILDEEGRALHAVIFREAPLAMYALDGALQGHTRKQILEQQATKEYRAQLKSRQSEFVRTAAEKIGRSPKVVHDYQLAVNAIVMALSPSEANTLRMLPDVLAVHPVLRHFPQTDRGPSHIGAPLLWNGTAAAGLPATSGEGMIVGVIDTGIRPEHPSFADIGDDGHDHVNPRGAGNYLGDCALPAAAHYCNDKLIGIVSFPEITDTYGDQAPPYGLDYEGHGTHVASTVAGNVLHDVPAYSEIGTLGEYVFPEISGVAPHANIVSYQICYAGDLGFGCDTALAVAAVEHAIENGVDVLNYSIGGFPDDPWQSIDGLAFLSARAAGIHVATSAGNNGPDWGTVGSPGSAPWLTSVAAYTHDRVFGDITVSNFVGGGTPPPALNGKGVTAGFAGPLVLAADFGDPQCLEAFDAGTFTGEIVVCERGENARVQKGVNVLAGGAGGMVLVNVDAQQDDVVADFHALPAIHLDHAASSALLGWLGSGSGHGAEISATVVGSDPALADRAGVFSSRGPGRPNEEMLAPHVAAPGVAIYGAFTEDQRFSSEPVEMPFTLLDGTSMASPHVAGAFALLAAVHPDWTPAEAQSALMLTAVTDTRNDLGEPSLPFDHGAGRIDIPAAAKAALVMDITEAEYLAADTAQGGDPATLNMPALVHDDCLVECQWTRRFRAVTAGSWTASAASNDPEVTVIVEPESFALVAGETAELTVTVRLATDNLVIPRWVYGDLRLVSSDAAVPEHHLPIVAAVTTALFPGAKHIFAERTRDAQIIDGMYSRSADVLSIAARGAKATRHTPGFTEDPTPDEPLDNPEGTTFWQMFTVTSEEDVLFGETRDVGADVDLFIGRDTNGDGAPSQAELENDLVCVSGTQSGSEDCVAYGMEPGNYWILVHNFLSNPGEILEQPVYTAHIQGDGSIDVHAEGPAAAARGEPYEVRFSWDLPLDHHELAYAMVSVGDDGSRVGNIGNVPVFMERFRDDVRLLVGAEEVSVEEDVTYTLRIGENSQHAQPRTYIIDVELPELVELVAVEGNPQRSGRRLRWTVTQEPYSLVEWISITVRPHRYFSQNTLEMAATHRLAGVDGAPEKATAPPLRVTQPRGGGSGLSLVALLLLALGVRHLRDE